MIKSILLPRASAPAAALLGVSLLALGCPVSALAAAATGAPPTGENAPLSLNTGGGAAHASSGGPSLVRTVVGLAIVIAVIWGLYWVMRQVKTGREPRGSSAGLASVAALTLGSGRSVHLVRAGNDYVLLASAEHGLVPIHRYTEQQAREAGLDAVEEQAPGARRLLRAPLQLPASPESARHDPMRMPSTPNSLVTRVREWTVRR